MHVQNKYKSYQKIRSLKSIRQHELSEVKLNQKSFIAISTPLGVTADDNNQHLLHVQRNIKKYLKLSHPSLVKIEDAFLDIKNNKQVNFFIITALQYQKNLRTFMRKRKHNDLDYLKTTLISLSQGVEYLHSKGIVHDDLNLTSIKQSEECYKIGFNITKQAKKLLYVQNNNQIQKEFVYDSPEKYQEKGYSYSSDVWSLGLIFIELITGQTMLDLTEGILPCTDELFLKDHIINRLANQSIRQLIVSMLKFDASERPTMKHIVKKLKNMNFLKIDSPYQYDSFIQYQEPNPLKLKIFVFPFKKSNNYDERFQINDQQVVTSNGIEMKMALELIDKKQCISIRLIINKNERKISFETTIEESMNSFFRLHFDNIKQLYNELNQNRSSIEIDEQGSLIFKIDSERAAILRKINFNKKKKYNEHRIEYHNSTQNQRIEEDRKYAQKLAKQYDKQKQTGYYQSLTPDSLAYHDDKNILKEKQYQIAKLFSQGYNLKGFKQIDQALNYFIKAYEIKINKNEETQTTIENKKIAITMIIQINLRLKMFAEAEKWIQTAKKDYPLTYKQIEIESYINYIKYSAEVEAVEDALIRIYASIDLSQPLQSYTLSVFYYCIFKQIKAKNLIQYYSFAFQLLTQSLNYFSQFKDNPQCIQNIRIIIRNIINCLKTLYYRPILYQFAKKFAEEHLKDQNLEAQQEGDGEQQQGQYRLILKTKYYQRP